MPPRKTGPAWGIGERRLAALRIVEAIRDRGPLTARELAAEVRSDDGRAVHAVVGALHLLGEIEPHALGGALPAVWAVSGDVIDLGTVRARLREHAQSDLARRIESLLRRKGGRRTAEWVAASLGREPGRAVGGALRGLRARRVVESTHPAGRESTVWWLWEGR